MFKSPAKLTPSPPTAAMRPLDLIRKKRDGGELSSDEIGFLVRAYTNDEIPDYQMAAWLMAVLIRGMTGPELSALTAAMLYSGEVLDLSDFPGPKVDKHSTGGVGDKTSLIIAPVVAAAGVTVPMISGRGLGHTGGTLDKLQSIPGFNINLSLSEFRRVLKSCGCGLIGQTAEIAPADKKIYALRDVTATVESPNLICASIMSKKLAEGIDGLVLDVKTGSGAFMKTEKDSVHLAELMVETGERMGKKMVALITDMDQPLGLKVGNALEVEECIEVMSGGGPPICVRFRLSLPPGCSTSRPVRRALTRVASWRTASFAIIPRSRSFARSSPNRAATRAPLTTPHACPRRSIRRKSSVQPVASWSPFNASRWELPA